MNAETPRHLTPEIVEGAIETVLGENFLNRGGAARRALIVFLNEIDCENITSPSSIQEKLCQPFRSFRESREASSEGLRVKFERIEENCKEIAFQIALALDFEAWVNNTKKATADSIPYSIKGVLITYLESLPEGQTFAYKALKQWNYVDGSKKIAYTGTRLYERINRLFGWREPVIRAILGDRADELLAAHPFVEKKPPKKKKRRERKKKPKAALERPSGFPRHLARGQILTLSFCGEFEPNGPFYSRLRKAFKKWNAGEIFKKETPEMGKIILTCETDNRAASGRFLSNLLNFLHEKGALDGLVCEVI